MADQPTVQQRYEKWKMGIPYLYDWFANHNLVWPSICCRWGPHLSESTFKWKQGLYMSERTDGTDPNKLMLVPVEICKPRVAAAETIAGFHEEGKSQFVKSPLKTILHQGEVNKIRELPDNPNIVATHSDAKEVFIWHFDRQPHRGDKGQKDNKELSVPDLTLTGHTENAEFALSISSAAPIIASGGQDTNVLLWNLRDYDGGSLLHGGESQQSASPQLQAATTLQGHSQIVGDIAFMPGSSAELASVGDDSYLLFWDARIGTSPTLRVEYAHKEQEIQCMDWSSQNTNMLATGAADGSLKVWDRRKTSEALNFFEVHTRALMRIEWASYGPGILASGGEDGIICVWDLQRKPSHGLEAKVGSDYPQELLFQHAGHRCGIADFQWHPKDPFTMVSVTDDNAGGTMHMWRINDLIYRPEAEAIMELERYKEEILPKDPATGFKKEGSQPPPKKAKVAVNGQPVKESKPAVNGQATKESKPTGNGQPVKDLADPGKSANPTAPAASLSVKETGERSSPAIKAPTPEPVVKPDLALTGADPAV